MPELNSSLSWIKALSLVCVTLCARALLDKLLAWQAGPMLVALWAQYQSLVDLVAGITLVGLGQGLTVYAARREHAFGVLLRAGTVWGLLLSGLLGLLVLALLPLFSRVFPTSTSLQGEWVVLAVAAGWLSVLPGLFLAWWQGRQQRGRMVLVLALSWLPLLASGLGLWGAPDLRRLLWVQVSTQAVLLIGMLLLHWHSYWQGGTWRGSPLPRYLWAGLSVGILSPLSLLWLRAQLAAQLSWDDVAQLQALWRLTEWVTGLVASILFLLYLPRLAQQHSPAEHGAQMRRIWRVVFYPAALVLLLLALLRVPLLTLLYDARFVMPGSAAVLFVLGDCLRIAAWVPLLGLFARERVAAIALGECLSLPLFALLITVVRPASLQTTAVLYVLAYLLYFLFNRAANQRPGWHLPNQ